MLQAASAVPCSTMHALQLSAQSAYSACPVALNAVCCPLAPGCPVAVSSVHCSMPSPCSTLLALQHSAWPAAWQQPGCSVAFPVYPCVPCCSTLHALPLQVTLIDRNERFVFKPLLYELLNGGAQAEEVAPPFRQLLAPYSITFVQAGFHPANTLPRLL